MTQPLITRYLKNADQPSHQAESSHNIAFLNSVIDDDMLNVTINTVVNVPVDNVPVVDVDVTDVNNDTIKRIFNKKSFELKPTCSTNVVVNLSSKQLDNDTITLLSKGLTFCPTPGEPDFGQIWSDLESFFRRLRLKYHFNNEDSLPEDYFIEPSTELNEFDTLIEQKFRCKSTWKPPQGDHALEAFIQAVTEDFGKMKPIKCHDNNLSKQERLALKDLQNDTNIVIKKADKGAAIVIMDRDDYVKEATRQLSDPKFYTTTSTDKTAEYAEEVTTLLNIMLSNDEISKTVYDNLKPSQPRTARFYFLPKIHKPTITGRPIISGNGCVTEGISSFVDEHIKKYVTMLPSHIKDTTHFIQTVESITLPEQCFLVTMDVTSLYTNIPNHEGITAVNRTLLENNYDSVVNKSSLLKMLTLVLHKNNFSFNGTNYLQIGGTAMGTKVAPSYANLFMGQLEKKLLKSLPKQPLIYKRFIDDIFMVFEGSEQELTQFITLCNNFHHSIKFTAEYSKTRAIFLDTIVLKEGNKLKTTLYTKETDTHSYLHYTSAHPKHMKEKGPYGQFLRLRRNCHDDQDFMHHSNNMVKDYQNRGYQTKPLLTLRNKASQQVRSDLLKPKPKKLKNDRIPLILTYNPTNPPIMKSIMKRWEILTSTADNKTLYGDPPIIATRRAKNIKDKLMKAELIPQKSLKQPYKVLEKLHCNHSRSCIIRPHFSFEKTFTSTTTGKTYSKKHIGNCTTMNVVYLLTCKICLKQYVGETGRELRTRISEHISSIKGTRPPTRVSAHFIKNGHPLQALKCEIIEAMKGPFPMEESRKTSRLSKETHWIHQLQTYHPNGMNVRG